MYEVVGQHQVDYSIHICGRAEVLIVVAAEGHVDAMMPVQHGCHSIKPEPIKSATIHLLTCFLASSSRSGRRAEMLIVIDLKAMVIL